MTTTDTARRSRSASGSPARDRCRRCDGTGRKRPFERRAAEGRD